MERSQMGRRNIIAKLTCIISLGVLAAFSSQATADVVTDPVGFITLTAHGTNGISGQAQSFLGLGMTGIVTNRGIILAKSGTKLTVNNTLAASAFNSVTAGPQFFFEVTSGANAGLQDDIVSNDTANVFTASDISSLVSSGQTYKVYPHWTLSKIFGANDEAGLDTADKIFVPNPLNQSFSIYFYSTAGKAGIGWRQQGGGSTDKGSVPISIDQGFIITKATATNVDVKLVGAVKLGTTIIPIAATNNFVGNVYATSAMTLSNSNLYTGNSATGLTTTDKLLIHDDNTGQFAIYFWSTGGKAGTGWRQQGGGSTEQGTTSIPLGKSVVLQLATGNNGFNWFAAAPY